MHERNALLLLHLLGLLLLTGGVGASLACKALAARSSSPAAVLALLEAARGAVRWSGLPGSLLLLGAGAALVARSNGAFEYHEPWIVGAIVLWLCSAVIGARLHAPRSRRAREVATRLAAEGHAATAELGAIIRGGRWASLIDVALLLGMVALMVFKPGR